MNKTTDPKLIKKQQQRLLLMILIGAALLFLVVTYLLKDKAAPQKPITKTETVSFATPLNHVDSQSYWVERAQNQLAEESKKSQALQQQMELLQQSKENDEKQKQQEIADLKSTVDSLQQQMAQRNKTPVNSLTTNTFPSTDGAAMSDQTSDSFISDDHLTLAPLPTAYKTIPVKNTDNFVPSGTIAQAVILEGADTPAGITNQGNPSPMVVRLLDQGSLPNHFHSHLKGCVATAAGIGDISSERGQIRLERLSCVDTVSHRVIEIPVKATIAGPDGKDGLQGHPLWRDGPLTQRAFTAGLLSGIGNGVSQSYTSNSLSPFGNMQTVDNSKIMQYGLATGVSNATEKLADYYIKQADLYHPVIQLSAGTVVDVVFLEGFYLDGKKHKDDEKDLLAPADETRASAIPVWSDANRPVDKNTITTTAYSSLAPLPLTPQQIQTLKQKNASQGYQ